MPRNPQAPATEKQLWRLNKEGLITLTSTIDVNHDRTIDWEAPITIEAADKAIREGLEEKAEGEAG